MARSKKEYDKQYKQTESGKKVRAKAQKKYLQSKKGKGAKRKQGQRYRKSEKGRKTIKEYWCSEKYKRQTSISYAKQRGLGWIPLFPNPFVNNVEVVWHHVSDEFVVAMPKDIHQLYCGYEEHRELCMNVISQIYEVVP